MAEYTKEQIKLLQEAQDLFTRTELSLDRQADIQNDILSGIIKNNDQLLNSLVYLDKIEKEEATILKVEQARTKALDDYVGVLQSTIKPMSKLKGLTEEGLKADKEKIARAVQLGQVTQDQANHLLKQLDTLDRINKNPIAREGFIAAGESIDKMQKGVDGFMSSLPGGQFLSKAFGIDKIGEKLQNNLISGGKLGFAGVLLAAGALFAILSKISTEAKKLSSETGLTFGQAMKLNEEMREASTAYGATLATQEDLVAVQKESIALFGNAGILSGEVAASVAETGKAFGYGALEAAKVNTEFMAMGLSGADAADAQLDLAASALKAGVNVGAVMKDISVNAKNVSKYFGGNVQALKDAAIEAQKLGISLDTMGKMSDSLLNFEESISAQFEFQALTGKQINLDKARELALNNDIAGASKEILGQVGSLAEFNSMNAIERESLAKATGMEVDALGKSLAIQEKISNLTKEEAAAMTNLNMSAAEIQEMSADQLRAELAKQQAVDQSAKAFEDIKNTFMTALAPFAQSFSEILVGIVPVLRVIGQILSYAFMPLVWAGEAVSGMLGLFNQYPGVMYTILGIATALYVMAKEQMIIEGFKTAKYEIQMALLIAQEGIMATLAAIQNSQLAGMIKTTVQLAIQGAVMLGKAIASIFSSFAMIPFGIGIPLAIAAVGGLVAMFASANKKKTGDLAMSAGGGPIVTNPREGTIFQGTKNDEVAMGPGVINAAQRTQPVTMAAQATTSANESRASIAGDQNRILADIANGAKNPAPVQIGTNVIREVNAAIQTENSYNLTPFRK
jgi:hypothetical protein